MHFSLVSFFSSSFGPNTFPFTLTLFWTIIRVKIDSHSDKQ
jgi:hypothetical protein